MFSLLSVPAMFACGGETEAPPETTQVGSTPAATGSAARPAVSVEVQAPARPTVEVQAPSRPSVTVTAPQPPSVVVTPPSPGSIEVN
ncbi:MAG: hypothetical protein M3Y87_02975 [Myxococcota bacterium]|nr:hypothetical protein [Myxococcota bacterium]